MNSYILVISTCATNKEAEKIASTLVKERLAACVNIIKVNRSIYRWKGKVQKDKEHLLLIKTKRSFYKQLERRIRQLHSYTVPELIYLQIRGGSSNYLKWLEDALSH